MGASFQAVPERKGGAWVASVAQQSQVLPLASPRRTPGRIRRPGMPAMGSSLQFDQVTAHGE